MSQFEPSPVNRRRFLGGAAAVGAMSALPSLVVPSAAHAATCGTYTIRYDQPQQTIKGLGFEIQSDTIGSANNGLPSAYGGVPYELEESERARFYQQMLKVRHDRGFRYCRLALGLYYRGMDSTKKHFIDRYPGQADLLAEMIEQGGVEGTAVEYWSPASGWKLDPDGAGGPAQPGLVGGSIADISPEALDAFSDAMVADLDHLVSRGIPVKMWGLQNEPTQSGVPYSSCYYTPEQYLATFLAVAPKIRQKYPDVLIHAESHHGWSQGIGQALTGNATALSYVDAWTYHTLGEGSEDSNYSMVPGRFTSGAKGKPVFSNEYEYLTGDVDPRRTVNTAQHLMNWMTFYNAPTWFWLHALKPTTNAEAGGYALGFWRPEADTDYSNPKYAHIKPKHWDFNYPNWNSLAGFVRYMPWDSVRYGVEESAVLADQRIMAWRTPQEKPVFALTNRSSEPFTFAVDTQTSAPFLGHRFSHGVHNMGLAFRTGPKLSITVPPYSIEFWVRTP
ncbi:twin-arginine translocation signal domain-containing protein [Streptomyces sp. NPDC008343]|uniref:twin-arginine translocation signal domain-containing protein n=1 Tax=Streptomyces sp. NPDC008343 TaxID=3364828 RepID=UPI0036ECC773